MELTCVALRQGPLRSILRRELGLSSGLVKRLKWKNALLVNDRPAHTDYPVSPGDRVRVLLDEAVEGFAPEPVPLTVLYEDEWLIALDKPAGQLVHPSAKRNSGTLANGLLCYYEKTGQRCGVHPVTRLDRDTFGVVLLAKSSHVHAKLCALLKSGALRKSYHAAVFGAPGEDAGTICLPIGRCGGGSLLRRIDENGQQAISEYRVLARLARTSLLELRPVTGRTHQLRLHCQASGFPILGDPQYFSEASKSCSDEAGLHTQQLCAVRLALPHPMTDLPLEICSRQEVLLPEKPGGPF